MRNILMCTGKVHAFRKVHKCVAVRVCGATLHKRVQIVAVQLAEVARLRAALTAHSHNALTSGFTSEHRLLFIAGASHNMQATLILLKPAPCRRAPRQLAAAEQKPSCTDASVEFWRRQIGLPWVVKDILEVQTSV